ncbi:MAG: hypothetical protein KGR98_01020 [Verrucomicrobia bacterium]|nr:hypothetical protein [Verrucomicrobiota bacterium]
MPKANWPAGQTIWKFRMVRQEGSREVAREMKHYNLDAILPPTPKPRKRKP